jgi:hypothetical protein
MRTAHGRWLLCLACVVRADGRARRVLPLGDSVTYGCGDQCEPGFNCTDPAAFRHSHYSHLGQDGHKGSHYHPGQAAGYGTVPCSRCSGGYRGKLLKMLWIEGQDVEMVGSLENDDGFGRHEGHIGWRIDQLEAVVDAPGGLGLGHDGAGGHDVKRRTVPLPTLGQNQGPAAAGVGVRNYSSMDGGAGWARLQPDIILLHAGTNDIAQGASADLVVERTRSLLTAIFRELPRAHVFHASLISMLPYGPARPVTNTEVMNQFNAQLPSVVAEFASRGYSAHYVPMYENTGLCDRDWAPPLGSTGRSPECCPEKNHPTDAGYLRIATEFFHSMKAELFPTVDDTQS